MIRSIALITILWTTAIAAPPKLPSSNTQAWREPTINIPLWKLPFKAITSIYKTHKSAKAYLQEGITGTDFSQRRQRISDVRFRQIIYNSEISRHLIRPDSSKLSRIKRLLIDYPIVFTTTALGLITYSSLAATFDSAVRFVTFPMLCCCWGTLPARTIITGPLQPITLPIKLTNILIYNLLISPTLTACRILGNNTSVTGKIASCERAASLLTYDLTLL